MKVVQGNYRQYQLVDKTRKKDIDGIRYLIAGERNLWAKLLRDKSETKKAEIYNLITRNGSTGFERPIELLTDEKGKFVGYTFYGPDMDIVPEKKQDTGIPPVNNPDIPDFSKPPVSTSGSTSGVTQLIILVVIGVLMLFIMKNLLNRYLLIFIYENISQVAGEGCARLSFDGILPGLLELRHWCCISAKRRRYGYHSEILFNGSIKFCSRGSDYLCGYWYNLCSGNWDFRSGKNLSVGNFYSNHSGCAYQNVFAGLEKIKYNNEIPLYRGFNIKFTKKGKRV